MRHSFDVRMALLLRHLSTGLLRSQTPRLVPLPGRDNCFHRESATGSTIHRWRISTWSLVMILNRKAPWCQTVRQNKCWMQYISFIMKLACDVVKLNIRRRQRCKGVDQCVFLNTQQHSVALTIDFKISFQQSYYDVLFSGLTILSRTNRSWWQTRKVFVMRRSTCQGVSQVLL